MRGLVPRSGQLDKIAQLVGHGCPRSLQRVGDGLLADAQPAGDGFLREDAPVVEINDLLLPIGEDLNIIEQGLGHQFALVDTKEIFVVNSTLLHGWKMRLDVAANLVTGSSQWAEVTEHIEPRFEGD